VFHFLTDRRRRAPAQKFVDSFHVAERRPGYARSIARAPVADAANEIAADVALQDSTGSVRLSSLDERRRRLWTDVIARSDEELEAGRALLLAAVRQRPGWPYHTSMLAMIEHARAQEARIWAELLLTSMQALPGDPSIANFGAFALANSWDEIDARTRNVAPAVFRASLSDPAFVSSNFAAIRDAVGAVTAEGFLPDAPGPIKAAQQLAIEEQDAEAAVRLQKRWERAEWRSRAEDLALIEDRAKFGDDLNVEWRCAAWLQHHSSYDFDHAQARKQVARLLELWPPKPGSWTSDPRAELVQYFLNARMGDIQPAVLVRTLDSLADVPAVVMARALLAAGDTYRAEQLAESAEGAGSFEWTPLFVDAAWRRLRAGDLTGATAALQRISPAARDECEAALVRRAVADTLGEAIDLPPGTFPRAYPAEFWSPSGVPICIDSTAGYRNLSVLMDVQHRPALVAFGFDGARATFALLQPGRSRIALPLQGRSGRHFFSYQVALGEQVSPVEAVLSAE
jgi:hypothetical protein